MIYHISSNKSQVSQKCHKITRVKLLGVQSATPQDMSFQVSKKGGRLASGYAVGGQGQSSWKIFNF